MGISEKIKHQNAYFLKDVLPLVNFAVYKNCLLMQVEKILTTRPANMFAMATYA